jgi:hypothetical protein
MYRDVLFKGLPGLFCVFARLIHGLMEPVIFLPFDAHGERQPDYGFSI